MNSSLKSDRGGVKLTRKGRIFAQGAFTAPELIVVLALVAILVAFLIPHSSAKAKAQRISCVGRLKNIGLAHRIFATDNGDLFPWQTNFHQLRNLTPGEQVVRLYQTLSNELSTPNIIACPADTRKPAANWQRLTTNNISYFLGLSAQETFPQSILAGDRNLTINGQPIQTGRVEILSNATNLGWDRTIHKFQGNVIMGDGSVQQLSQARLREQFKNSGLTTNIFLFP